MLAHDATMTKGYRKQATGRYSLCHSGDWFSSLGNGSSTVQEHQTRILLLTYLRCSRLCPRSLHPQSICNVHPIHPHRMCLGSHIGNAIYLGDKCTRGLWPLGNLSRIVQRYHLYSTNYRCGYWRSTPSDGWFRTK